MSIFSSWFSRSVSTSLSSSPEPWLVSLFGRASKAGQDVSIDSTMGIPALWGAYRVMSESIASLPIEVFERKTDGNYPASDQPVRKLLRIEPNDLYSAYDLKSINVLVLCSTGNYFNRIYRRRNGNIYRIVRLDPAKVTILYDYKNLKIFYEVTDHTYQKEILEHDDIEHVKIMSKDGIIGRSPITVCMEAFGMMLAAQEYGATFYANGAHLSGILSTALPINEGQQKQILNWWNERNKSQKGGTAVLGSDMKYSRISATPAEANLIEVFGLSDRQINQIFRIPGHLNGDLSRSTNNNIEQQSLDFLTHTLRPFIKAIENEKNRKYWRTEANQEKYFVDFNIDALLRANTEARAAFYNTMVTLGIFSINEVRSLENMNKVEGGDTHRVQLNMVDLNQSNIPSPSNTPTLDNGKK